MVSKVYFKVGNYSLFPVYNNPPVILQGNPIPAVALPHIHQFTAAPPNVFIPPPVVHPQGPAPNHFMAGPYAPPPVVHQPPPPFPIGGHQHAPFAPPPPGPPGGQHPHPPMQPGPPGLQAPPRFRSRSSIPDLGCTLPILHCPASCTSAHTKQWRFRGSKT